VSATEENPAMLTIEFPIHGAILNRHLGKTTPDGLRIEVAGTAPLGGCVTVNGAVAQRAGTRFMAEILLAEAETEIRAAYAGTEGQASQTVRVLWDRYSEKRYRFSIDDNSFFLRQIARERPKSLFDCFYLKILRDLHRKYGAKFTVNVFYATPGNDFTLAEFPTDYRGEWADNGDWLKLAFHAYAEFPDRPYQYASAEKLATDFDLVAGEILRIAGDMKRTEPTKTEFQILMRALRDTNLPKFVLADFGIFDQVFQHITRTLAVAAPNAVEHGFKCGFFMPTVLICINTRRLNRRWLIVHRVRVVLILSSWSKITSSLLGFNLCLRRGC